MSLKELAPTYFTRLRSVLREVGAPKRILNAGCGDGVYDLHLKNARTEIFSIDINKGDIQIARTLNPEETLLYCVADIKTMPFEACVFDCIVCTDVIEHLPDDMGAIYELCRCLRKGGKFIITVPSKNFPLFYDPINFILNRFGKKQKIGAWAWGHERLYTKREIERKTGLKLIKTEYLSKSLVGFLENSYLNSLFQKFTKNDPLNRGHIGRHLNRTMRTVRYQIPTAFSAIRNLIIWLDGMFCRGSKKSVGIMVVFRK